MASSHDKIDLVRPYLEVFYGVKSAGTKWKKNSIGKHGDGQITDQLPILSSQLLLIMSRVIFVMSRRLGIDKKQQS